MESPLIIHERLKTQEDIEGYAYTRLFENYLKHELRGDKKYIELESTDQESVLYKFTRGRPVPGMIYTFLHFNKENLIQIENLKTGKSISFHDYSPIVFCTYYDFVKKNMRGINLTLLPRQDRLKFLEAYYQYYKNFLIDIEKKTQENKIAVNLKYIIAAYTGKNPKLFQYFNKTQKSYFEFGYRTYNLANVDKFRMIEYEEWNYIPFYNPTQVIKNVGLSKLYDLFNINKSQYL